MLCATHPCRFPAPSPGSRSGKRVVTIREIERQASEAWRATPCEVPVGGTDAAAKAAVPVAQAEVETSTAAETETEAETVAMAVTEERNAIAAYDFLTVQVPRQSDGQGGGGSGGNQAASSRRQPPARNNNNNSAKRRKRTQAQGPSS
jgi:hypothetical protein